MSYCKFRDCFGEEACNRQCKECESYDCCGLDREVDVHITADEKINTSRVIIETIFKLKT